MILKLPELQNSSLEAKELRTELSEDQKDMKSILHSQSFLYVPEIIYSKIMH